LFNFFDQASLNTENIIFHFFSRGDTFNRLKKINTNSKIHFHGLVEKEHLEELYHKSDVQIIPQKEGNSKGSLPLKLFNLLASECKLLLITNPDSELQKLFQINNLDFVVTSWNTKELINSLQTLIDKPVDFNHQKSVAFFFFTIDKMILKLLR
jgi:colanic acid biosynthesis glycosyl transferase WcaI